MDTYITRWIIGGPGPLGRAPSNISAGITSVLPEENYANRDSWADRVSRDALFSYGGHYPMAFKAEGPAGPGVDCIWVNQDRYSATTAQHVATVRYALDWCRWAPTQYTREFRTSGSHTYLYRAWYRTAYLYQHKWVKCDTCGVYYWNERGLFAHLVKDHPLKGRDQWGKLESTRDPDTLTLWRMEEDPKFRARMEKQLRA